MKLPISILASLAVMALTCLGACNDDPAPLTKDGGPTPAGQPRSFVNDVVPIVSKQCAQPACHGDTANPDVLVHFMATEPSVLYMQMLATSPTAKDVKLIAPGDPSKSYIYSKVVGDQSKFQSVCTLPGCGVIMPPGSKLSTDDRATLLAWIMEGAKDN